MITAMTSAVSGLNVEQQALDVVGGNLANMNTPGYKDNQVTFQQAMSQVLSGASAPTSTTGGVDPQEMGLGVTVGTMSPNYAQGQIQSTGNDANMAISGNGFFVVSMPDGTQAYTRDGNFSVDTSGTLVTASGMNVQGWTASNGAINTSAATGALKIPMGTMTLAQATSTMSMSGDLDATAAVYSAGPPATGGQQSATGQVYDSLGISHTIDMVYTKVTPTVAGGGGQWNWTCTVDGAANASTGTLVFGNDGTLNTVASTTNPTISFTPTNGAAPVSIATSFTSIDQLTPTSTPTVIMNSQNGCAPGVLQSYSVDQNGTIEGTFSNGLGAKLGQVATATFANDQGLVSGQGDLMLQSAASGLASVQAAGTGMSGTITDGALESSNVNLETEFTNMIVAQRAFEANSKMITVVDQVLQDLVNLKQA